MTEEYFDSQWGDELSKRNFMDSLGSELTAFRWANKWPADANCCNDVQIIIHLFINSYSKGELWPK